MKRIDIVSNSAWSIFNFRYGLLQTLLDQQCEVFVIAPTDACSAKMRAMGCVVIDMPMSANGLNPVDDTVASIPHDAVLQKNSAAIYYPLHDKAEYLWFSRRTAGRGAIHCGYNSPGLFVCYPQLVDQGCFTAV
jgi:hypothetical protein